MSNHWQVQAIVIALVAGPIILWKVVRLFRWLRNKPAPQPPAPPELSPQDAWVLHQAGLTRAQWEALTHPQRAQLRWRIGLGPR